MQMLLLDTAAKSNPNAVWWIKGDGADIVPGLYESVQQKWYGDVDLNDGDLQDSYKQYKTRLDFVAGLGLGSRARSILEDLRMLHQQILSDKEFMIKGVQKNNGQ